MKRVLVALVLLAACGHPPDRVTADPDAHDVALPELTTTTLRTYDDASSYEITLPPPSTTVPSRPKAKTSRGQAARPNANKGLSGPGRAASTPPVGDEIWHALARCEAGAHGLWLANTGNGYYGGLQFKLSSWRAVGGVGYPHQASPAMQIEMGKRLQRLQGWGAWPRCARKLGLLP